MGSRYIPDTEIEETAEQTLCRYIEKYPGVKTFPTPVDEICEVLFNITIEPINFAEVFRTDTTIAALCQCPNGRNVIYVDTSLDPYEHPQLEGRYRFSVAHELGHYLLHYDDLIKQQKGDTFFDLPQRPLIFCRSSSKERIEIQADHFAAFLLMPKSHIVAAWERMFGVNHGPEDVSEEIADIRANPNFQYTPVCHLAHQMAKEFHVSGEAMQRRLTELGLLKLEFDPQLSLL